jgi:hypothetical protein
LAFLEPEHPEFVHPSGRAPTDHAKLRADTDDLIERWSRAVTASLDEQYRRLSTASADQVAGFAQLGEWLGVDPSTARFEPDESDIDFAWESVAGGCVLALLDLLADTGQDELRLEELWQQTAARLDAERFERATGMAPDEHALVLQCAAEAMASEPIAQQLLYRSREMFVRWDGDVIEIEREVPPERMRTAPEHERVPALV